MARWRTLTFIHELKAWHLDLYIQSREKLKDLVAASGFS